MSSMDLLSRMRSALRPERSIRDWNMSAPLDEELAEDESPRFNRLMVVVSGEMEDYTSASSNGTAINTFITNEDDDESLLGLSSGSGSPGPAMETCEGCVKQKERGKRNRVMRKLALAAVLYLLFMIGELVGGYLANSLAIMTDALHMLTDLVGIVISLLALWLSAKSPTNRFTFGLHRLEVMSAGVSVLLIYILTGVLLNEAVQRTLHQDFTIDGDIMLITAGLGVAVNVIMSSLLSQCGHLHSHGHSHGHTHAQRSGHDQQRDSSLAVRAAFIHAVGDLVQSLGVLIAAYVIRFKPEYKLADPVCTYLFSVLVLVTTFRIMRDTGLILLEGVPTHLDVNVIKEDLLKLEDVEAVEELKLWALTGDKIAAIAHLKLLSGSVGKWEEVQANARQVLMMSHGVSHCTVQLQSRGQVAPQNCSACVLSA